VRSVRFAVWSLGILLIPAGIAVARWYSLLAGLALLVVAACVLAAATRKLECPGCHKSIRVVSTRLEHCPYCGAAYELVEAAEDVG